MLISGVSYFFNGPSGDVYDIAIATANRCNLTCMKVQNSRGRDLNSSRVTSGNEVLIMGSLGEKTTYQSRRTIRVKTNTVFVGRCVRKRQQSGSRIMFGLLRRL